MVGEVGYMVNTKGTCFSGDNGRRSFNKWVKEVVTTCYVYTM